MTEQNETLLIIVAGVAFVILAGIIWFIWKIVWKIVEIFSLGAQAPVRKSEERDMDHIVRTHVRHGFKAAFFEAGIFMFLRGLEEKLSQIDKKNINKHLTSINDAKDVKKDRELPLSDHEKKREN